MYTSSCLKPSSQLDLPKVRFNHLSSYQAVLNESLYTPTYQRSILLVSRTRDQPLPHLARFRRGRRGRRLAVCSAQQERVLTTPTFSIDGINILGCIQIFIGYKSRLLSIFVDVTFELPMSRLWIILFGNPPSRKNSHNPFR